MPVYVDDERIPWRGRLWGHLVADTLDELHCFAGNLGLKRDWFQESATYPHYDITTAVRAKALQMGALHADRAKTAACFLKLKAELIASRAGAASSLAGSPPGNQPCQLSLFSSPR